MTQNAQYIYYRKYNTQPLGETTSQQEEQYIYQRALQLLATRLQGRLLLPGDVDFDETAHDVWYYGTADHHPALIVHCVQAADVAEAITFAREFDLEVAVRSGGHSPGSNWRTRISQHSVIRDNVFHLNHNIKPTVTI